VHGSALPAGAAILLLRPIAFETNVDT